MLLYYAVRKLHNAETGIDVSITSFKEDHGLLTTSYKYNILVVTNIPCFKEEELKPSDVVQFVVI